MEDKKKSTAVGGFIGIIIFLIVIAIITISTGNDSEKDETKIEYYIGDTVRYEDIDITVTRITCQKNDNTSSDHYGLNEIKIYFTYKNVGTKDFNVRASDINIRTESKGEIYNYTEFSATQTIVDAFLDETIIAGTEKTYHITFFVPYSLEETKYTMLFDWGILYDEQEYHLYLSNGSNANYTPTIDNEKEDTSEDIEGANEELKQTIKNLQGDLYNIFKQYVYDQITGNMYYSDIQNLIDNAERQVKTQISTFNINYDLSSGTYSPKWIGQVTTNNSKTYSLFYIQVQLTTNYKWTNKNISKYDIK